MDEMDAPNVLENKPEKNNIKFDVTESFEITFNKKRFVLTISYNENLIFLDIEEKDVFIKEEYNIYLSLEQLGKINKYFKQFDTLKEVFDSLKFIIQNKSMTITKEENTMKIKIINPGNGKEFFINIPLKKKDLKAEIDSIIPYVSSLNAKIQILENKVNDLEKKLNEFYIYKSEIKNLIKKEVKEYLLKQSIKKSNILKNEEFDLFLNWFDRKPFKLKLLFDSKIDGDLMSTFYNKCGGKFPTVVLVKNKKGHRYGGYSSIPWKDNNYEYSFDKENFIFSFDKKEKYKIIFPKYAMQSGKDFFAFGGSPDFVIYNKCTSLSNTYSGDPDAYGITKNYVLNFGESNYTISRFEIYQIEY